MGEQSGWNRFRFDRRDFIKYSLATTVAVWAGSNVPVGLGVSQAEAQDLFAVAENPEDPAASVFPQSVASGDPQPRGIVLWTRVNPRVVLQRRRRRRRSDRRRRRRRAIVDLYVAYQVARDESFTDIALSGVLATSPDRGYTVKTQLKDAAELEPFTTYYYRFIYGGTPSKTGRFKTLPEATGTVLGGQVRFGYISCQDYTNGYYNALRFLADEEIDFVVHLGDYIYETVDDANFQNGQVRTITLPNEGDPKEADTLNDYRFLYQTYKSDKDLQKAHENFAFINIWDDHEFANDCYQTVAPDAQTGTTPVPQRREAANRAWAEYSPVGETGPTEEQVLYNAAEPNPLNEITIYRSFAFGDLMELVMTDERLYRDGPPAGNDLQDRYLTPGGKGEDSPSRTILGRSPDGTVPSGSPNASRQKDYFTNRMLGSTRKWKIWGNEVTFMQFKVANSYLELFPGTPTLPVLPDPNSDGVYVTLDQWDGFQAERNEIIEKVGGAVEAPEQEVPDVKNFVTITGDIHSFIAGYIKRNFDDANPITSPPQNVPGAPPPQDAVGVEFVCGSITSANLAELATFGRGRSGLPDDRANVSNALVESNNRHFRYFNSETHGYNIMEVTPDKLTCTMKAVSTVKAPTATLSTLKVFEVPDGEVRINDVTSVVAP